MRLKAKRKLLSPTIKIDSLKMLSTAMDALRLLEFLLHLLQQNVLVFYLLRIALEQEVQKEWLMRQE